MKGGGGGVRAFNSVSGKIQVKMTERFNLLINTINKHIKMLKKKTYSPKCRSFLTQKSPD